jgi:hypothetical protein
MLGRIVRTPLALWLVPLSLAAASLACGGSKSSASSTADASADATGAADGAADGGSDAPTEAGSCRTDVVHRPTADACPSHADAGAIDSGTCGSPLIPQDACLVDGDCAGAHGASDVCVCQAPQGQGCGTPPITGNACVPSSCHVDTDCASCGRCRIEQSCGVVTGYYCESPSDTCSSNADCGSGFCTFQGDHFSCRNDVACAG